MQSHAFQDPDTRLEPKNLPKELQEVSEKLIKAMEDGDSNEIRKYCIPHTVDITTQPRPQTREEFGQDINLPFVKAGFDKTLRYAYKIADGYYCLHTRTSHLCFVETKASGWRLYYYTDSPPVRPSDVKFVTPKSLPKELQEVSEKLIKAMKDGDKKEIEKYCVPHAVEITTEPRPASAFGRDINIPFLKKGFDETVRLANKLGDGCYALHTQTTHMFFVEMKGSGWKLYRYSDFTIE
jgi:hypothetical protein